MSSGAPVCATTRSWRSLSITKRSGGNRDERLRTQRRLASHIEATPGAEVVIGSHRFPAVHRILNQKEAVTVLAGYEGRNRWIALVIRPVLSRLLGWRYDGSDEHRRRPAAQLPFIAFGPRQ